MCLEPFNDSTYTEFLFEASEKLSSSIHYYRIQFELDKVVQLVNILVGQRSENLREQVYNCILPWLDQVDDNIL